MLEKMEIILAPLAWLLFFGNVTVVGCAALMEFAPKSKCSVAIESMNRLLSNAVRGFSPGTIRARQVHPR